MCGKLSEIDSSKGSEVFLAEIRGFAARGTMLHAML